MLLAAVEQEPRGPDGQWGYLQKQVIAEAVERPGQAAALRELGVDALQGYACHRPMAAGELEQMLRAARG